LRKETGFLEEIVFCNTNFLKYGYTSKEYLDKVNQGKREEQWLIGCIRLAPNAPKQNPIEDICL
jgi:hypothetical protein